MNNDLISRSALIKWIDDSVSQYGHTYSTDMLNMWGLFKDYLINNAPTVEPSLNLDNITDEEIEKFKIIWQRANSKGLLAINEERPQCEWISAEAKLPEDMQRVLIWFEYYRYGDFNCMYQTYGFGYVCDGKWSPFINGETGWQDYRIIAWQPLPEPYKKGE